MVIVGIAGEGAELLVKWLKKKRFKKFQRNWGAGFRRFMAVLAGFVRTRELEVETIAFAMVIVGLVAEFLGGQKSQEILDRNNARLNSETTSLQSSNLALSLRIEALRATNDMLEGESLPMQIGDQQSFADAIGAAPSAIIIVTNNPQDEKSRQTAWDINWVLKEAGWSVSWTHKRIPFGVLINCSGDLEDDKNPTVNAAIRLFKALTDRNIPATLNHSDLPPKTILVDVEQRPDPGEYESSVLWAKQNIAFIDLFRFVSTNDAKNTNSSWQIEASRLDKLWRESVRDFAQQRINLMSKKNADTQKSNPLALYSGGLASILSSNSRPFEVFLEGRNVMVSFTNGEPSSVTVFPFRPPWFGPPQ